MEALTQVAVERQPVLLVAYDTEYPQPLHAKRPIPDAFGVALVLTPQRARRLAWRESTAALTDESADELTDPELEALRASIPAARCLPLLRLLARGARGRAVLDYLDVSRAGRAGRTMQLRSQPGSKRTSRITAACACSMRSSTGTRSISAAAAALIALPDHPLRSHGRLGVACGIEYAAQAMAVHGALTGGAGVAPARPRAGLSRQRCADVRLHVLRLDDMRADLHLRGRAHCRRSRQRAV